MAADNPGLHRVIAIEVGDEFPLDALVEQDLTLHVAVILNGVDHLGLVEVWIFPAGSEGRLRIG